ncbi:mCG145625, partial [Mus musculus]
RSQQIRLQRHDPELFGVNSPRTAMNPRSSCFLLSTVGITVFSTKGTTHRHDLKMTQPPFQSYHLGAHFSQECLGDNGDT